MVCTKYALQTYLFLMFERFKEFQQEQQARHSHSSPAQVAQQQHSYQQQQQFKQLQHKLELQHQMQQQQQKMQQQQQQLEHQKQMSIEQHLVKTSPKIIEQAGPQEQIIGTNASQPPPRQFFRAESQPDVMLQQQQHQVNMCFWFSIFQAENPSIKNR